MGRRERGGKREEGKREGEGKKGKGMEGKGKRKSRTTLWSVERRSKGGEGDYLYMESDASSLQSCLSLCRFTIMRRPGGKGRTSTTWMRTPLVYSLIFCFLDYYYHIFVSRTTTTRRAGRRTRRATSTWMSRATTTTRRATATPSRTKKVPTNLLVAELPYDPVCPSVGWLV